MPFTAPQLTLVSPYPPSECLRRLEISTDAWGPLRLLARAPSVERPLLRMRGAARFTLSPNVAAGNPFVIHYFASLHPGPGSGTTIKGRVGLSTSAIAVLGLVAGAMVAVLSGPLLTSSFELNVLLCATLAMLTLWLIPGYLSAGTRDYITTFLTAVAAARRQPDAP